MQVHLQNIMTVTDSPYAMYKYLGEEVCKLYRKSFDVDIQIQDFIMYMVLVNH